MADRFASLLPADDPPQGPDTDPSGPVQLRSEELHNPDQFQVPTKDNLGHDETMSFKLLPGYYNAMQGIGRDPNWGFGSPSNFCRYAVVRLLHYLKAEYQDKGKFPDSSFIRAEAMAEIMREERHAANFNRFVAQLKDGVEDDELADRADRTTSRMERLAHHILALPDLDLWREDYAKALLAYRKYIPTHLRPSLRRAAKGGKKETP